MRAINYLDEIASRFGKSRKTVGLVDRSLAETGFRRKGRGRAIPRPNAKESIALILAVCGAVLPKDAVAVAQHWMSVPCRSENDLSGGATTFGMSLPDVIVDVAEEIEYLELNTTTGMAAIDLKDGSSLLFAPMSERSKVLDAEYFVRIRGTAIAASIRDGVFTDA